MNLTEKGHFFNKRLASFGVTTSYLPLLNNLKNLLTANVNFIAFNRFNGSGVLDGHVMSVFIIVLAAAEAAVALAIIINLYRNIGSVDVDDARSLRG